MERYDMSLKDFIKNYPREFIRQYDDILIQLARLLERMTDDFHIRHLDLHPGNIVIRINPNLRITEMRIIDFNLVTEAFPGEYRDIEEIYAWLDRERQDILET